LNFSAFELVGLSNAVAAAFKQLREQHLDIVIIK